MAQYTFDTGSTVFIAACTLVSGNVAIAWREPGTSNLLTAVYNSAGTKLGGDTILFTGTTNEIAIDALTGGNYVVAFSDSAVHGMAFAICSNVAAIVKAATTAQATVAAELDVVGLDNGGFMLVYNDSADGRLATYDAAGTEVTAPKDFDAGSIDTATGIRGALLDNTNVMIIYGDSGGVGTLLVVDEAGTEVVSKVVFESGQVDIDAKPLVLSTSNVMIIYMDDGDGDKGKFCIHQPDGTQVTAPTVFKDALILAEFGAAISGGSGDILIAYKVASNDGEYIVLDEAGAVVTAATVFESGQADYMAVAKFSDGNDVIAFRQAGASGPGILDIRAYTSAFAPPADIVTNKRLVAFSNNTMYYEDI